MRIDLFFIGERDYMRDFEGWLQSFKEDIAGYDYYVDFQKVIEKTDKVKVHLNILNSLIGSDTIKEDFLALLEDYPKILSSLPILLAVRKKEIYSQDIDGAYIYNFKKANYSLDQYATFMEKTGLFDMIANHMVSNLVDYVYGVETGLDSNGRKNRRGHQMENLVEQFIKKTGVTYYKEMYAGEVEDKWSIDLSALVNDGKSQKRFDFVVCVNQHVYAIETNFYGSGGSKLNETARSYKMLAEEAKAISRFTFVWITDGCGWYKTKRNLLETFEVLPTLYNIAELQNGALDTLFKGKTNEINA